MARPAELVTTNGNALLSTPPTETTMLPVIAPAGTGTTMLVGFQTLGVADIPLNVITLVPCEFPKFTPVSVMGVPADPEDDERLVRIGPVPGVGAGRISTMLMSKESVAGAVSFSVTEVPLFAIVCAACCIQKSDPVKDEHPNSHPGSA